jgi:hypothetical protein
MDMWLKCLMASFCLFVAIQTAAAAPPANPCNLPPGLSDELSKKYAGTHVVSQEDLSKNDRQSFQKDHGRRCPGLAKVNFYGDGKPTWAVVLIAGENPKRKAELIVARQIADGWETRSLEATDGTPVVWREGPGKYDDLDGKKVIHATKPVIVFAGYGSWSILYAWTGKDVEKVQLSD